MLFTTPVYLVFLLLITVVHFSLPGRWRWGWLLLVGYAFYGSWSPTFLPLLLYVTGLAYAAGRSLPTIGAVWRQRVLWLAITGLLLPLLVLKYAAFFQRAVNDAAAWAGFTYPESYHPYLLPAGISFFTFQTISYVIDIYRGYQRPEKHLGYFALYVAFFPVVLAGPIERAKRLLPQLRRIGSDTTGAFRYDDAVAGLLLILWGCFKKLVLARRLQEYANLVFDKPGDHYGLSILLGCSFFALQLYCDFSAYSDIATGSARLLGIRLSPNFANRVYASRSRTEFWQGWHMSLTSWFRDYVFAPLSKHRRSKGALYGNLMIIYLLTGLWHGAAWSFVIWGILNGGWVLAEQVSRPARRTFFERIGFGPDRPLHQVLSTLLTFTIGALLGLWFRIDTAADGLTLLRHLLVADWTVVIPGSSVDKLVVIGAGLLTMDLVYRRAGNRSVDEVLMSWPNRVVRWSVVLTLAEVILLLGETGQPTFYYFRF